MQILSWLANHIQNSNLLLSLAGLERKDVVVRKAQKLSFFSIMTHHLSFEKLVMIKRRCCHQSILLDNAHWLTRF
jgi:hypothetical protein